MATSEGTYQEMNIKLGHENLLLSSLNEFYERGIHSDCTLSCEDGDIQAHKIILSSCSSYFHRIFNNTSLHPHHPIVFLRGVKYEDIKTIIDVIYSGETNVKGDRLKDIINLAKELKIIGLSDVKESTLNSLAKEALISSIGHGRIFYPGIRFNKTVDDNSKTKTKKKISICQSPGHLDKSDNGQANGTVTSVGTSILDPITKNLADHKKKKSARSHSKIVNNDRGNKLWTSPEINTLLKLIIEEIKTGPVKEKKALAQKLSQGLKKFNYNRDRQQVLMKIYGLETAYNNLKAKEATRKIEEKFAPYMKNMDAVFSSNNLRFYNKFHPKKEVSV